MFSDFIWVSEIVHFEFIVALHQSVWLRIVPILVQCTKNRKRSLNRLIHSWFGDSLLLWIAKVYLTINIIRKDAHLLASNSNFMSRLFCGLRFRMIHRAIFEILSLYAVPGSGVPIEQTKNVLRVPSKRDARKKIKYILLRISFYLV